MYKIFLLALIQFGIISNAFADGTDSLINSDYSYKRPALNVNAKDEMILKIILPEGELEADLIPFNKANSYLFAPGLAPSKSEEHYFQNLSYIMKWFLRNYKIGSIDKKKFMFGFNTDINSGKFPYVYTISFNNLKLLNNRGFGGQDIVFFNDKGGLVYPLKEILKKGKFLSFKGLGENKDFDNKYKNFLKNYSFSSGEDSIEAMFLKKKTK